MIAAWKVPPAPAPEYISRADALIAVCGAELPDKSVDGVPIANGKRKVSDCVRRIKAIPAANVREVKRAKWREGVYAGYRCPVCATTWDAPTNYCPNCGADMREGEA